MRLQKRGEKIQQMSGQLDSPGLLKLEAENKRENDGGERAFFLCEFMIL
jgi:hypothetical protein